MMQTDILVLIPARLGSSRLPAKALADIGGQPMVVRVWQCAQAAGLGEVVVATDSEEIAAAVGKAGGRAVMTRADHASGSDRIREAAEIVDPGRQVRLILNLQGDLPALAPADIAAVLTPLDDPAVDIATLATEIRDEADRDNPNVVKLVGTPAGPGRLRALYFTRARAPWGEGPLLHHIGIYAYRRAALDRFVALPPSPLEQRERLEQLRALESGMRIDAALIARAPVEVNTEADLQAARKLFATMSPPAAG